MVDPRAARPTWQFVDEYCEMYADLFPEVRSFESFKYPHVGMISELKRKTLPTIAKVVGLNNEQGLHHVLTKSPGSVARTPLAERSSMRQTRLKLILELVNEQSMLLLIDESGDCKKGNHTITLNDNTLATWARRKMELLQSLLTGYSRAWSYR